MGVAVSDELGLYAHPRCTIPARPRPKLLEALARIVAEERITRVIVGLPLDMKGGEGEAARKARTLAQSIADATGCEVELWDERLTTVVAKRDLRMSDVTGARARALVDEAAAVNILQSWLDGQATR